MHAYWVYGLSVHAEIACPELPLHPQTIEKPDVTVRLLSPVPDRPEPPDARYYEVRPRHFRMSIPGVAHYRVEQGTGIFIEPIEGASLERIRLFLLGSAMGALLYQRGLFPLHGSAVETPWGAMVFVGVQGAGKSTLAAQFHRSGYRLLSDDVCAIEVGSDGLRILPALSQVRLCPDAYDRLGAPDLARFDVDKYVVPMGAGYCPTPVPLRAIHVLSDNDGQDTKIDVLRGFDRVKHILDNLYRPHYLEGQETQVDLFRLAGSIAQQATVISVKRPRNAEAIAGLVTSLELVWAEQFHADVVKEHDA